MNKEDIPEKKSETASCFGNLTMERVIKDESGQLKSGSLVFRIKRISSKDNDDSGIKCSSPSADELSNEEQVENCPIRVQIPKTLLLKTENGKRSGGSECNLPEDFTMQNENNDLNVWNDSRITKNVATRPVNINTTTTMSEAKIKFHQRGRRRGSKVKIPIELRRRSRRIVHLQLQKECQDSSTDVASNVEYDVQAVPVCENNQIAPTTIVKKRRKKRALKAAKSVSQIVERKKRKYTRRVKPLKSELEGNFEMRRQYLPATSTIKKDSTKNEAPEPSSNYVWTLVPRSLFESDFFKSQIVKSYPSVPLNHNKLATNSAEFSPSSTTQPLSRVPNTRIRLKYPTNFISTVSAVPPKMVEEKTSKRPTVIYFKKNFNAYLTNQASTTSLQSELSNKTETLKNHNDLLYLCNKYRMLDAAVVKNFYELTRHNISATESMLSNLLSRSLGVTSDEKIENGCVKQSTSPNNYIFGIDSTDAMPNHFGMTDSPQSPLPSREDADTLCCNIIIESLKILFSEEAVLQ